jgi:hypothetical protein
MLAVSWATCSLMWCSKDKDEAGIDSITSVLRGDGGIAKQKDSPLEEAG